MKTLYIVRVRGRDENGEIEEWGHEIIHATREKRDRAVWIYQNIGGLETQAYERTEKPDPDARLGHVGCE